jgi:hypothetical protein
MMLQGLIVGYINSFKRVAFALFILMAAQVGASISGDMPKDSGAIPHTATVEETMNSGGYTYARVSEGNKSFWIAVALMELKEGETISFYETMMMEQFTSKTLQRTFDRILFVSAINKGDTLPKVATPVAVTDDSQVRELGDAEGRFSVADVYAKAPELAGKTIEVKGKVVKISHQIMARNWVHVQDGTGEGPTSKIVFRSIHEGVAVGDEVVAKGILELNKTFGANYYYPVIVEDSVFAK